MYKVADILVMVVVVVAVVGRPKSLLMDTLLQF